MNKAGENTGGKQWLLLLSGVLLIVSFFLPWVSWEDTSVSGYAMPAGTFFSISSSKFGLENPFPQFSFALYVFWLIPILATIAILLAWMNKKTARVSYIAGALSLALVTVFILFTRTLIDLGVGKNVLGMLKAAAYIHVIAAVLLIASTLPVKSFSSKFFWLLAGPVLAFGSYKLGEKYIMGETFKTTNNVKADYTVTASGLIHEFMENDSLANKKYREKVLIVNGIAAESETQSDSTVTVKFTDPSGSYVIFSLDKDQYEKAKNINPGDSVSLKGSCSGSVYSEILSTTSISFKRTTLNK